VRFSNKFLAVAYAAVTLLMLPGCGSDGGDYVPPPTDDPTQTPPLPPDDFESRRQEESLNSLESRWKGAVASKPTGVSATLDVTGSSLFLSTEGQAQIDAPAVLTPAPLFPKDLRYLFFTNAQVGTETGVLVLEGPKIQLTTGTLGSVDVSGAVAHTHAPDGSPAPTVELTTRDTVSASKPTFTFPADWSNASDALFFSKAAAIHGSNLTLSGFTRGVLVTSTGSTAITGSVTVASSNLMFWDAESHVDVMASTIQSPQFALGGAVEAGALTASDLQPLTPPPSMLKGKQAQVTLRPGSAKSEGAFQLTQAVTQQGMLLPADVEIAFDALPVTVKKGQRALIPVVFREKGLRGDAVLSDLQVTGSGKDAVSVPLGSVEPFVEKLWKEVGETGIVAPFLAITLMPLTPFIALGDALVCLFTTCPKAYPVWVDAGKVARFHIIIQGTVAPGTYEATVTLTGRNYATLTVPVKFTVTE
jgi:hypothetical protein